MCVEMISELPLPVPSTSQSGLGPTTSRGFFSTTSGVLDDTGLDTSGSSRRLSSAITGTGRIGGLKGNGRGVQTHDD